MFNFKICKDNAFVAKGNTVDGTHPFSCTSARNHKAITGKGILF